jgi:RNA polymerase sigma-70 factor, ECF subfamily
MVESTDQDRSLIRAAQGGNHIAFEQLVRAHDQAVLRLAFRITGSESDAQDVHQEAFLKIYKKLDGFRFECAFSTWVYRIATNVCRDQLRRKRARAEGRAIESNVDNFLNQVSDDRPVNNPEQQLLRLELGAHIARALRRLTPRERLVFELKHFQGLKLQKVSEILDCSEPAVKTSLFRATKKLRLNLARYARGTVKQRGDQDLNSCRIPVITLRERQAFTLR